MKNYIEGFICRSRFSSQIMIGMPTKDFKGPRKNKVGWYEHVPGWFYSMPIRAFKKAFGFSVEPGTHSLVKIKILRGIK